MGIELKPGSRYRSAVGVTEVVVVKAPTGDTDLRCGGHPVVPLDGDGPEGLEPAPGFEEGLLVGKRYADEGGDLEVLCTKAGPGSLSVGGDVLGVKGAKPLPSSD